MAHDIEGLIFWDFTFCLSNKMAEISSRTVLLNKINVRFSFNYINTLENIRMVKVFVNTDFLSQ